jgi:Guanylate kinase
MAGLLDLVYNLSMEEVRRLIEDYQPLESTKDLIRKMQIVFLVGITGAGKDSIVNILLEDTRYAWIVAHATRQPRINKGVMERDGEKYYFVDEVKVLDMLKNHEFVEAKIVHEEVRGTSVKELQRIYDFGKIALKDLDFQGAIDYRKMSSAVKTIFVLPPSYEVWRERLSDRYSDSVQDKYDLEKRMKSAVRELTSAMENDVFQLVVNDDLRVAAEEVSGIISGDIDSSAKREQNIEIAREILVKIKEDFGL